MKDVIIGFKSVPEMYRKEESGTKPNTIRKFEDDDNRLKVLKIWIKKKDYGSICVTNTETGEYFTRQITDVTFWKGWTIISWEKNEYV